MSNLNAFAENKYSQFGEDGIISEILDRLSKHIGLDNWCVEFGAWDGVNLSNTCGLIRERGYKAVLIEGDSERVKSLIKNFPQDEVLKINKMVGLVGKNSLDHILSQTPTPSDFDVLSIDIDGCDYWILESLKSFNPKILVIEYNPTIPNSIEYVQAPDFKIKQGSSPLSIKILANAKGYDLVASTQTNLIFVDKRYSELVLPGVKNLQLDDFRDDSFWRISIFSGYDGTLLTNRPLYLPWHDINVKASSFQAIPRLFRKYPGDFNRIKKQAWFIIRKIFSSSLKKK